MKTEIIKIVIKVLIYALGLIAAYFGVTSLSSCSSSHSMETTGITRIHVTDTTFVKHSGFIRSKNYLPYD